MKINYKSKKIIVITVIISLTLALGFMKFDSLRDEEVNFLHDLDNINISNIEYVVNYNSVIPMGITSEKEWEKAVNDSSNFLLFFTKDGDWRVFKTNMLENTQSIWTNEGLYLSDIKYDYFIDNSGVINMKDNQNYKKNIQEGTISESQKISDKNKNVWSFSHVGFKNDGYETQVTKQKGENSTKFLMEGAYSHFFEFNNKIYATTTVISLDNDINSDDSINLVELVEKNNVMKPKVITKMPFNYDRVYLETFSINNKIYSLIETWNFQSSLERDLALVEWDLIKGHHEPELIIKDIQKEQGYNSSLTEYKVIQSQSENNKVYVKTPWGKVFDVSLDGDELKVNDKIELSTNDQTSVITNSYLNSLYVFEQTNNSKNIKVSRMSFLNDLSIAETDLKIRNKSKLLDFLNRNGIENFDLNNITINPN